MDDRAANAPTGFDRNAKNWSRTIVLNAASDRCMSR
jgi:hypothetical protein